MKNQLWWALFFCLVATSCYYGEPLTSAPPANNKTYKVEYLFEHEGCKIYRFHDLGHVVYFTNCNGETISYPDSTTIIRNKIDKN